MNWKTNKIWGINEKPKGIRPIPPKAPPEPKSTEIRIIIK